MSILIIGGDKRNKYLFDQLFHDNHEVYQYGLTDVLDDNILNKNYRIVVGQIPFTKDKVNLYTPLIKDNIPISFLDNVLNSNTHLFSGSIPEGCIPKCNYIDLTKNDTLYKKIVTATSEGILQIILNTIEFTISNSKLLITGYGKVGKDIAQLLKGFGAEISVYSTNDEEKKEIINEYKLVEINDISKYQIIINTIPFIIFNETKLRQIHKSCTMIDVASFPGGIDIEFAKNNGIQYIKALGIPGNKAPLSISIAMKQIISEYL